VADIVRKVVSEATFYSWKKKFGAMGTAEIRELRQLREENSKLKRLVADLSLTPMRRRFDLPFSARPFRSANAARRPPASSSASFRFRITEKP